MQKCLFFLLALFSLTVQARANWNPYSMDYERFVHLTENDKRAVVISTMELMVELESKYQKEVTTSGYSSERFQKYVQLIEKLQNFVLSSATAASSEKTLPQLAGEFSKLLSSLGSNGCIYGGYVSKMTTLNGSKYCRHPSSMNSKDPKELAIKNAYLSKNKTCVAPSNISCNPVVFGYEAAGSTQPFCVATGNIQSGKAHNVSYSCMKKALEETPDKEARLKVISDAIAVPENKEAFNKVHGFIFRTCACGDEKLDKDYVRYMKPHRTCYGMMNTLRIIKNNECSQIDNVQSTEFADEWSRYFGKEAAFPDLKPERSGDFDKAYGSLIDKDAVKAICSGEKPIIPTIVPVDGKPEWICETKCSKQVAKEGETPKVICKIEKAGWDIIKAGQTEPEFKDASKELKSLELVVDDPKATTTSAELKDGTKQACPVALEPEVVAKTCKIAFSEETDPKKSKATVSFEGLADKEEPDFKWTGGTATADPKEVLVDNGEAEAEALKVSVDFTIKGAADKKAYKCEEAIPKMPAVTADEGFKITTTAGAPKDKKVKVTATVTINGKNELIDGYDIYWTRQAETKPVVVENSVAQVDLDANGKPVKVETSLETKDEPVAASELGKGKEINPAQEATKFNVCASLVETSTGKSKAGPSCQPIPALEAAKPQNNNYNPSQNSAPPQFIMPVNNTRQMGIQ